VNSRNRRAAILGAAVDVVLLSDCESYPPAEDRVVEPVAKSAAGLAQGQHRQRGHPK
jgi:hypothetical protein